MRKQVNKSLFSIIFLMLVSVTFVTICSKCSPIYPLNNWDDANCFFTVGKSIANGSVLYRDIFEQKGPLLYFIYAVAYFISNNSFVGVYAIEIISGLFFLLFAWKTIELFLHEKALILMPFVALLIYGCAAFQMGGSSEEICLPWVMYSVYIGTKALNNDLIIKKKYWFIIGLAIGCVFWIKFSMIGFFIGMIVFFAVLYIKIHCTKEIIKIFSFAFLGVIVVTLPIIIYCFLTESFSELFEVYFYNNMFAYTKADHSNPLISIFISLLMGALSMMKNNTLCLPLVLCAVIFFFFKARRLTALLLVEFVFAFVLIYSGGRRYAYYSLVLCVFIPIGLSVVYVLLRKCSSLRRLSRYSSKMLFGFFFALCGVIVFFVSSNTYMLKYNKQDLAQYQFAEIINKSNCPTLLNYGFMDGGFYTTCGIIPNCRYFCTLNVNHDIIECEQNMYISKNKIEFIVAIDPNLSFDGYSLVCEAETENRAGDFVHYYLFRRNRQMAN